MQAEQRGGRKEVCVGRDAVETEWISRFNSSSVVKPHRLIAPKLARVFRTSRQTTGGSQVERYVIRSRPLPKWA